MNRRHVVQGVVVLLLGLGTWQIASAGWIHAKALLAQRLIASAWEEARDGGPARRPWPWADMRPIARLTVPARGVELYVLDIASLRALAFGPAHVGGTAAPGSFGNSVVVAHRDTHFAFLEKVEVGDEIDVEAPGALTRYRVSEVTIIDKDEARVMDEPGVPQLTLVTCYPFDAVRPGTRLRYVVVASRIEPAHVSLAGKLMPPSP
ncbi:MAG TPA: class GN sortase [Usitatibacter sp.]|nr:class GN sortase [Usitatibacter sp.]